MKKHKRLILLVVAVVVALGLGGFVYKKHKHDQIYNQFKHPHVIKSTVASPVNFNQPGDETEYQAITTKVSKKSWADVLVLSEKFGDNTKNPTVLRITAYAYCVYAVTQLGNSNQSTACSTKGHSLIASLNKNAQDAETTIFMTIAQNGTTSKDTTDQGDIRG